MNTEDLKRHEEICREMQKTLLEFQSTIKAEGSEGGLRIVNILEMQIRDWQRELDWIAHELGYEG